MSDQIETNNLIDAALQLKWGPFPATDLGDDSPDPIHLEVGRSLSQWEMMEVALGLTYQTMCQGRYSEGLMGAASRTYGLITSATVRKTVLAEIAEIFAVFVDPEFDLLRFKRLLEQYAKASALRNNLAHGYVSSISVDGTPHGYYLVPAAYITKRNLRVDQWEEFKSKAPKPDFPSMAYLYTSSDIARIRSQFEVLAKGCGAFHYQALAKNVQIQMELAQTYAKSPPAALRGE